MIHRGLEKFQGKNVLLLQGPVGPFFSRLADDLRAVGATVQKVNFHAGDWLFYRQGALAFNQPLDAWPAFFADVLMKGRIDAVLLYGDCRPVHALAHKIALEHGVDLGVFEEGYLRPRHITLERHGVNGHSSLPRSPEHYLNLPDLPDVPDQDVGNTYWHMVWWGFGYFTVGALGKPWFPHPVHHRKLSILEALPWLRSAWRKSWYGWKERKLLPELLSRWSGRYFVVPLQVFNDTQIQVHSKFQNVQEFLDEVMRSFANSAPADTALVIKHHPMDRGYIDYSAHIAELAEQLGLNGRCFYLHDQHLPTMLDHARGVLVINSTVGLQALRHGVGVKALGEAIYNLRGLCHQGALDAFWHEAPDYKPDARVLRQFVRFLKLDSQINGSYYRRMDTSPWRSGVVWPVGNSPLEPEIDPVPGYRVLVSESKYPAHTGIAVVRGGRHKLGSYSGGEAIAP